jgi:hypothetical protein
MINLRRTGPKKEVMLLNPEDHRFTTLKVDRETDEVIYCKKHDGILYRFFKLGPGWTEKAVRFLAVEGTPLVSYIKKEGEETEDVITDLESYLRIIWTDKGYNGLPRPLKEKVNETNTGTTVTVLPFIPDEDIQNKFDELKAEGVLYDADLNNLANLGTAKEVKSWVDKTMDRIPWVLAGFGLTYVLMGLGVLKGF